MTKGEQQREFLAPEEMQQWLQQELADSAKAHALRIKEATEFVRAYTEGKISADDAEERYWHYQHRWGEILPMHVNKDVTDAQIIAALDAAAGEYSTPKVIREKFRKQFGSSGQSR